MKKRGLSEVVTTLILVLLVLVAIAIVWVVISNLIRDKGDDIGAITKVSIRPIGGSEGNEKVGEVVGERKLSYDQSVKSLGGLIAWWKLDGDAKDATGNGHDGTNNGATFVDGKVGKAADFDGVNDYIAI